MRNMRRATPAVLYAILATACAAFFLTQGLAYEVNAYGRTKHVGELISPGANDNLVVLFDTALMLIAAAARYAPKRPPKWAERGLFALCWLGALAGLRSMEAGSLRLTLLWDGNLALWLWLAAFAALPLAMIADWRRGAEAEAPEEEEETEPSHLSRVKSLDEEPTRRGEGRFRE